MAETVGKSRENGQEDLDGVERSGGTSLDLTRLTRRPNEYFLRHLHRFSF
jgi:hypothetical protein